METCRFVLYLVNCALKMKNDFGKYYWLDQFHLEMSITNAIYKLYCGSERDKFLLSPQVKQWEVITCKYGMYKFPHDFRNVLRVMVLGN